MAFTTQDKKFMRRALTLARRGVGRTSPNPAVGAVLVKNGRIIGEGWHKKAGGPHAEIFALRRARQPTLYVTLEPCSTWGKTPPCTDAIIAAGVRRVVVAATDPNPKHRGRGLRILRRAGIRVDAGLLAEEAKRLNEAFNKWITTGRPLVIAKAAMSLDGKIATRTGDSKWITSEVARREAHKLRASVDAVMVAAGTVRRDNPRLTLRHRVHGRQPWRVVLDARGRCSRDAALFTDKWRHRTIVITTALSSNAWRRYLALLGIAVLVVGRDGEHVDLPAALRALGTLEVTSVMVEGGSDLLGAMFDKRLVDKVDFFYAAMVIGGREAVAAVGGEGADKIAHVVSVTRDCRWRWVGRGVVQFEGYCDEVAG